MEHLDLPLMGGARNRPASAPPARIQLECRSSNMSLLPRSQRPVPRTENPRRKTPKKTSLSPITPLEQIRVIIADDHPVVREGLSSILRSLEGVQVVGEAANGEEACELYDQHSPDVLLVDLRMPEKDGLQVVAELMAERTPKPRIIVITTYESEEDIRRAVRAGAKGYLLKVADPEQIEEAIRAVAAGRSLFPTEITLKLAQSVAHPELTKRELEVLQCIANGRSNKEIGSILYISEATVKGHVRSILGKLEAIGRAQAIAIATKRGLIHPNTWPANSVRFSDYAVIAG
jgi:DNA-binding NarL/FixJ family response regulator